jgi:hypothetical protein
MLLGSTAIGIRKFGKNGVTKQFTLAVSLEE